MITKEENNQKSVHAINRVLIKIGTFWCDFSTHKKEESKVVCKKNHKIVWLFLLCVCRGISTWSSKVYANHTHGDWYIIPADWCQAWHRVSVGNGRCHINQGSHTMWKNFKTPWILYFPLLGLEKAWNLLKNMKNLEFCFNI